MLTIYKASAGSGKTYTLAKEYILQLVAYKVKTDDADAPRRYNLRQPGERAHRTILAITFSNQATDEMKSRIIEELAKLADMSKESNYRKDFVKEYGFDPQRLAEVAQQALQDLLFDFRFFNVSTIDSFFQGVIRSFAREIDLPGNYEVEMNDSQAVGVAVAEMFQSLNDPTAQDKQLMRWIISYMNSKIEEGGKFNVLNRGSGVHSTVVMGLTKLMNEDYHSNAEKINKYFSSDPSRIVRFDQALAERKRTLRKRFTDNAQRAVQAANDYGLGEKTINGTIRDRMSRWAAGEKYDPADATRASLTNIGPDVKGKRYYAAYFKGNQVPQAVDDAIVAMLAEAPDLGRQIDNVDVIRRSLFLFGLLGYIGDFISNYRRDNNTILISDTNELLTRIMQDELTPFIYERLGVFLEHFLIDEFQDTSKMQWRNLRPLLLESLGNGDDNLIIGDEKQCIYRFRNSDPELLASIVKSDVDGGLSHSVTVEKGNCVAENTNYRSTPNVVKFNNTLFPVLARQLDAHTTYANTVQSVGKSKSPVRGYVKVEVMDCAKKDEFTEKTLSSLAQEVRRQLQTGYRPKDIAVIVREHSEGQQVIDHLLRLMEGEEPYFAKRFDITSRGALKISTSPLVKLIISILRLIDTPEASTSDRTSSAMKLAQLTTRFEYYFNREGLDATESLQRALEDESGHIDRITRGAVTMRLVNLHSIVEHIIGTFISSEQRDAYSIFLSAFQDLVVDYCSRGQADVHSFLQWWDARGHNELLATPDDLDALTVITAHASKGLQYKCVHIP
ncbi:MAG: UvrD-helicase domain-containing protein, partial [Muribaculaceae bacterium]|nr:UvrD-helicase domain-containing protein [Muribaculaceae bacterium]